jgi:site-specific DNA-methyltransferase (adenine-specific)
MQRVNQADAELAWTSFKNSVRVYQFHCSKLQGFQNPNRFHPTEKPISLYEWILQGYAKSGYKILDPHLGSGSSRIAAYKGGFDFVGFENDKEYFEKQEKRFNEFKAQLVIF